MIQASINSKYPKWYIRDKKHKIKVPQNWQEMTESQVLAVMPILMKGKDEAESLPILVKAVLSVPKYMLYGMDETVMYESFYNNLSWVYQLPILSPKPSLISQDGVVYQLPKETLKSLTIQQYYECDEAIKEYLKSAKEEHLQRFLQSFLTPVSKNKGCSDFGKLKEVYKFYSLYYFLSCRDWISRYFFDFDPKNKKNSIVKNAAVRQSYDWRTGLLSIAETGIFGNHAQVVQTPCHDIFRYLKMKSPKAKKSNDLRDIIRNNHQKHLN